jgi:hypothetical protein
VTIVLDGLKTKLTQVDGEAGTAIRTAVIHQEHLSRATPIVAMTSRQAVKCGGHGLVLGNWGLNSLGRRRRRKRYFMRMRAVVVGTRWHANSHDLIALGPPGVEVFLKIDLGRVHDSS